MPAIIKYLRETPRVCALWLKIKRKTKHSTVPAPECKLTDSWQKAQIKKLTTTLRIAVLHPGFRRSPNEKHQILPHDGKFFLRGAAAGLLKDTAV